MCCGSLGLPGGECLRSLATQLPVEVYYEATTSSLKVRYTCHDELDVRTICHHDMSIVHLINTAIFSGPLARGSLKQAHNPRAGYRSSKSQATIAYIIEI